MKKTTWRSVTDAVFFLAVFIVVQIAAVLLCQAVLPSSRDAVAATVYGTILSSVIIVALFTWRKWSPSVSIYLHSRPWDALPWVATAAMGAMVLSDAVVGAAGLDMPDDYVRLFAGIMNNEFGYLAIGIFAPVAEEMVFRGGILRSLLRLTNGRNCWMAIVFSALLFGVVHGNVAQGVNAFLLGLLLGWMYYRTDSIVPGILFHWVNNTIAFILFRLMPDMADATLYDMCGGNTLLQLFYIACALCVLLPSLHQLSFRLKKT